MTTRRETRKHGRLIALLISGLLVLGAGAGTAVGEERNGPRRQMVALTNQDRAEYDRDALAFATGLSRYAKQHSREMADAGYLFHSTADELRAALDGYDWELGGENIGVGGSLDSLQDAFMASELHRKNILRKVYEHAAVGIHRQDDRIWITVIFYG